MQIAMTHCLHAYLSRFWLVLTRLDLLLIRPSLGPAFRTSLRDVQDVLMPRSPGMGKSGLIPGSW